MAPEAGLARRLMDRYTVYQSARGGGKTNWIINQVGERYSFADDQLRIAVVVPIRKFARPFTELRIPLDVYTEVMLQRARGRRYDYVYVDNADLFQDDPLELCARYFPGTPASFTYTPLEGSSLPRPTPKSPKTRVWSERETMLLYMLAYIYRTGETT